MGTKITTKKVKIVGTEQYINATTGEVEEMNVISIEERDFNFHKLWLQNILNSIELIGNQKTKLAFWIIENLNRDNILIATYDEICKKTGISKDTVKKTMKILLENNFLQKIQHSVYRVNPDVIFKGKRQGRMKVLIDYKDTARLNELKAKKETEIKIRENTLREYFPVHQQNTNPEVVFTN